MKRTVNQRMSQVLGLAEQTATNLQPRTMEVVPASSQEVTILPPAVEAEHEQDISDDYQFARRTLYHLIEMGNEALTHLMPLAKEAESPRGFEVTHLLLKTTSEMAKDLIDLHQRMDTLQMLKAKETQAASITNIQNVVVTTADMVRMAREAIAETSEESNA